MQNPKISIPSFFDEIEKISTPLGALAGALVGGAYLGTMSALNNSNKKSLTKSDKKKRALSALLSGVIMGGTVGAFTPLRLGHIAPGMEARQAARRAEAIRLRNPPRPIVNIPPAPPARPPTPPAQTPNPRRDRFELIEVD